MGRALASTSARPARNKGALLCATEARPRTPEVGTIGRRRLWQTSGDMWRTSRGPERRALAEVKPRKGGTTTPRPHKRMTGASARATRQGTATRTIPTARHYVAHAPKHSYSHKKVAQTPLRTHRDTLQRQRCVAAQGTALQCLVRVRGADLPRTSQTASERGLIAVRGGPPRHTRTPPQRRRLCSHCAKSLHGSENAAMQAVEPSREREATNVDGPTSDTNMSRKGIHFLGTERLSCDARERSVVHGSCRKRLWYGIVRNPLHCRR